MAVRPRNPSLPDLETRLQPQSRLLTDTLSRPELFNWRGPESRVRLGDWAAGIHGLVSSELLAWWALHGGGELFETETLLSPLADPRSGDDVDGVTLLHQAKGLPSEWIVFHIGWGVSAFNKKNGTFAWFENQDYTSPRTFDSLDDWYVRTLRAEFSARYGMA